MREAKVQKDIIDLITRRGGYVKKYAAGMYSGSGKGDLIACYRGDFIMIEVKKVGAKTDPYRIKEQEAHLRKVHVAGGFGILVESAAEVAELLDYIDRH